MEASLTTEWAETFGEHFTRQGPETRAALLALLPDDWTFAGKRVLDFGSGPGRVLREFRAEAESAEFWGADVDPTSVAKLEATLCPPMHAWRCASWPPLGLEHGSFDLIWAISVFTHLTDNSLPWLLELHRLLKPDGLLIATYIGPAHSELLADEPWDEHRIGMNVLRHSHAWRHGGPMVLMSDWWVRAHWGRAFELVEIAHDIQNMSWVVLRRLDVDLTTDDLARPADDPRELAAVRHNIRQAQRELEATLRAEAEELEQLQREYESSLSWRLTRPLRALRSRRS